MSTGYQKGRGLDAGVARIVDTSASDIARIPEEPVTASEINAVLRKTTFSRLLRNSILERVPQPGKSEEVERRADGNPVRYYEVPTRVRERVETISQPQLPCGCTGFTTTAEGHECHCGSEYDRTTVIEELELSLEGGES